MLTFKFDFRMTDLGSVTYHSLPDLRHINGAVDSERIEINIPTHPRKFKNKPHGIPQKQQTSHPPTIMEAYSQEHEEEEDISGNNRETEDEVKEEENKRHSGGSGTRSLRRSDAIIESVDDEIEQMSESEKNFGSGDLLTDNDSLERVDKIGYTNVIADVTVHESNTAENVTAKSKHISVTNRSESGAQGDVSSKTKEVCSVQCNNTQKKGSNVSKSTNAQTNRVSGSAHDSVSDTGTSPVDSIKNGTMDSSISVDEVDFDVQTPVENRAIEMGLSVDEDETAEQNGESLEEIERQIIHNGSNGIHVEHNANADTDCNKNQTKGPVTFQQNPDGEIIEETIEPVHSIPVEGKPPRTATGRRESWASRKLRKTLGLKEKNEDKDEEDEIDGKSKVNFLYFFFFKRTE